MSRSGADLALLLLGGFRSLVDAATAELGRRGYEDVRPVHDFAMRAIAVGAGNASELGRRLSVSKQAAAKTIAALQERGYVTRGTTPAMPAACAFRSPRSDSRCCAQVRRSSMSCAINGSGRSVPPSSRALRRTWQRWPAISPSLGHSGLDVARPRRANLDELTRPVPAALGDEGIPVHERIAPTPWHRRDDPAPAKEALRFRVALYKAPGRGRCCASGALGGTGQLSGGPGGHTATQGNSPRLSAQYAAPHSSPGPDLQVANTFAPWHGWSFPAAYAQAGCATGCNGGHLQMRAARRR